MALDDTDIAARAAAGEASAADRTPADPDASAEGSEGADPTGRAAIAWGDVARWAAVGLLLLVTFVAMDVHLRGADNPLSLIQPGTEGPSTALFEQDFPDDEQPNDRGLDGQQYYAIARDPLHLDETAEHLDHPRYRFQRPLLPVAAWALHPTGGGLPLVAALVFVSFLGIVVLAMAAGGLSMALRGPPWVAAIVPLMPGAYWSLRVTVSDAMALGLALAAILLATRDRRGWAVAVACLAVLAKEPAILVLLGWSLSRRTRKDALLTLIPGAVVVGWMAWLNLQLPPDLPRSKDIGPPFEGFVKAWTEIWSQGDDRLAMLCIVSGLGLAVAALAMRGLRHPLGWPVLVQLGFLIVMGMNPLGTDFGGTRMGLTIAVLSILALATPRGDEALPRTGWRPNGLLGRGRPAPEDADRAVTAPATAPA